MTKGTMKQWEISRSSKNKLTLFDKKKSCIKTTLNHSKMTSKMLINKLLT